MTTMLVLIVTQDAGQASLSQNPRGITSPALYSSSPDTLKLDLTELRKLGFRYIEIIGARFLADSTKGSLPYWATAARSPAESRKWQLIGMS